MEQDEWRHGVVLSVQTRTGVCVQSWNSLAHQYVRSRRDGAVRDCSKRGGIVLDNFGGSGTTLIAAEKVGRRARVLEYDPAYCDTIVRRWEAFTGKHATLAETGATFEDVELERADTSENMEDVA